MRDAHRPRSIAAEADGPYRLPDLASVCLLVGLGLGTAWLGLFSPSNVLAFVGIPFGVGGSNAADETSRYPIKIELRGFLNTDPKPETLVVISLGVNTFQGIYYFDVRQARLVDNPHSSITAILRRAGKYIVDFNVTGRRELLSKIGQSPPGTPLIVTGMFQQRRRKLQLLNIDIVDSLAVTTPVEIDESDVDAQD